MAIIQMDGNLPAGPKLVKNDPNPQNNNGKMFMEFLERNPTLTVVNALDICEGLITRRRQLKSKCEEAVLDFFIVNEKVRPFLRKMIVDEVREYGLSNFAQQRKNKRVIDSDHNSEILELDIQYSHRKPDREEIFNMRNKICQDAFKVETENNPKLLEVFDNQEPFKTQCNMWLKNFNSILHKCFKKVRIVRNKKKEKEEPENLLMRRIKLIKESKSAKIKDEERIAIEERIKVIEDEIGAEGYEESIKEIVETINTLGGGDTSLDGNGRHQIWKLLKTKYPKNPPAVPVGKKDWGGNIITNHIGLKNLYAQTYKHRLRNRPIIPDFEDIKNMKTELFNVRLELSGMRKSDPWLMEHLDAALKGLKKNKARDPNGWANEIFKEGVAGKDMKISMLKLLNKIKLENFIPDFTRLADVATIYKEKNVI